MNEAFRREFQRVLPLCGSIGAETSEPQEADAQPKATAAADCLRPAKPAADGHGKTTTTRLTTVIDVAVGDAATKSAAATGAAGNVQYVNDAAL